MALKKDFKWAKSCGNNETYHNIRESFHWSHEHPQYHCIHCWQRFTPLHQLDKGESYIERVIHFFRWGTQ